MSDSRTHTWNGVVFFFVCSLPKTYQPSSLNHEIKHVLILKRDFFLANKRIVQNNLDIFLVSFIWYFCHFFYIFWKFLDFTCIFSNLNFIFVFSSIFFCFHRIFFLFRIILCFPRIILDFPNSCVVLASWEVWLHSHDRL